MAQNSASAKAIRATTFAPLGTGSFPTTPVAKVADIAKSSDRERESDYCPCIVVYRADGVRFR